MPRVRRCPNCLRPIKPDQLYCTMDVLFMARQATAAYDDIRRLDPALDEDARVVAAISYIESGHAHHRRPQIGCPFCRVPA